jgi:drug/metabolite transporter (DMT)-like permease
LVAIKTMDGAAWLFVLYLAIVCTIVGYTLWFIVIRESEVNIAGLTVLVQPVAGLFLSVLWIGERLHWGQLWGSAVIVVGLAIGLRNGRPAPTLPVMEVRTEGIEPGASTAGTLSGLRSSSKP